ncbi:LOW QUALITY PROTEIN: transcriptional regulator ATRX homolog [Ctenocephalides felis]|uniref:LOW QUALITY PROTEIN: transcriptional regulator ATRX homolog n=1 Tax=Ctenocephalides felis TaxID=7515 RepID=UPI000E6E56BA|nr:LOW QUALITY PROTEIN: transcriptional regulator ATRX homolog [Ctenocephalides felis]
MSDKGSIKRRTRGSKKSQNQELNESEDSDDKEEESEKLAEDKKSNDEDGDGDKKSGEDQEMESEKSDNEDGDGEKKNSDDEKNTDDEKKNDDKISFDSDDSDDIKMIKKKKDSDDDDSDDEKENKDKSDSDSDSDIVVTKRRRTKRKKDSDDSDKSSDSDKKTKKKRRRVKTGDDSSAGSGSDADSPNKGRKNIRKVIKTKNLDEATLQAAKEEKERKARIEERQKLYNSLYDDKLMKEAKVDKLVLDFDPETKKELITVHKKLVKHLKPHQATGVKFMFDACFESVKQIDKGYGSGCILAHCMGLGKSLQVVTLVHTLLMHEELTKVRCVLVVCPLSTVLNWVNEFTIWLKNINDGEDINIYELSKFKKNNERAFQLSDWQKCGGVMIMGYDMFRNLTNDKGARLRKKMKESLQRSLVDPGPDLVVCDEGHLLKNEKTSLSQAMTKIKTGKRIVLTGTPVQNNLKEYYCMVQFVKPNLLGKYNEYMNRFVNPITNGQYTDSTPRDIEIMKRRSHVLHKMLDGCVQRRDYSVLAPFLPPKHEYVLFINLTELQIKLYQFYLDNFARRPAADRKNSSFLFPDFQNFQRIWTHPRVMKANSERYERDQAKKAERDTDSEGSLVDFIDDSGSNESSSEEESMSMSGSSDESNKKGSSRKNADNNARNTRASRRNQGLPAPPQEEEENETEEKRENPTEWWMPLCPEEELDYLKHSGKLMLLFDILKECETIGDKILVFSQSLYSLDVIEHFLSQIDERTQNQSDNVLGHRGSWSPGLDYFRLDGSTSCENRAAWCKSFNRADNIRARLFLISTRAGGLGINLVAANRVIIFDVSWNPSHDVQSIFRVYRFGQKKPCYIYRFIARGTMEEKVYERQVTKQAISKRVIDEQQIDRHYNSNDLNELYKFEPIPAEPRPTPKLPKDRLFAELLHGHDKLIYHFHEHDSLLENKEEETLDEEERKAAWEEFENEKKAPPPQMYQHQQYGRGNFGTGSNLFGIPMNMVLSLLTTMVKADNPMLTDNEVKSVIPAMSQKLIAATQAGDYSILERMKSLYVQQQNMILQQQYNNMSYQGQYVGAVNQPNQMYIQQQQMMLKQQQQQQQLLKQQQQMARMNQQQTSRLVNPFSKTTNHQPSILKNNQPSATAPASSTVASSRSRRLPSLQDFVDLDSD